MLGFPSPLLHNCSPHSCWGSHLSYLAIPPCAQSLSPHSMSLPPSCHMDALDFGLNKKCPPQAPVFNAWFPAGGTILGGPGNFSRWGLVGESRSLGADFECYTWSLVPSSFSLSAIS
jgi:hypothetical protein